ncbi:MAG: carboxypeptidase regulatory-like domain-containing protein [Armatimonadetes bacterium]|nr:carboxypeptidase regulatory-like domain-containing protein [Armatimonadota bacterium]
MAHRSGSFAACALALALLLHGCGGGGGVVALAGVRGIVTNALGAALSGVTLRSGSVTTTSGADGSYSLSLPAGAGRKVTASRAGFVGTFQVVTLAADQTAPMDFALNPVGQSTALTSLLSTPAVATDPRGAEVHLAANTLVDSNGAAVDSATVAVTTALPSDAKFGASFPGLFIGIQNGTDADIESFGFVTIDITTNAGLACNLKPGATADIAIPVAPAADPGTPTIDLWSLDETTGKWLFVVAATRDASGSPVVYRGTVTHFSTWNLDQAVMYANDAPPVTVHVWNTTVGTSLAGASVVLSTTNKTNGAKWESRGVSGVDGSIAFASVPRSDDVVVTGLKDGLSGSGHYQHDPQPGMTEGFDLVLH